MPGLLDALNDIADTFAAELGGSEHLYRLKGDGLYRISNDREVRVEGDLRQRAPSIVKSVPPVYPPEARAIGLEEEVALQAVIARDGTVEVVGVSRSVPALDAAAIAAVEQWEYHPVLLNGRPIRVLTEVTVRFSLDPA